MRGLTAASSSLRGRLLLLVLLPAIPLLGLALYGYVEERERASGEAQAETLRLARIAAADQERVIDEARLLLYVVAALPEVRSGDTDACNATMLRLRDELGSFQSMGLIDTQGTIVCAALPQARGLIVADRTYFLRALATRQFAVGDYQISRSVGTANINFAYPVVGDGDEIVAVVYVALNLDWLNQYAADAQLPPDSTLTVLDSSGSILARYPDPERWSGQSVRDSRLITDLLSRSDEGTAEGTDVDGVARIFAFVPLTDPAVQARASLIVGVPAAPAYASANREFTRNVVVLIAVWLVTLGVCWFVAERRIFQPVAAIVRATRRLSAGALDARTGLRPAPGEIGHLVGTFDEMAQALQDAAAHRDLEERLRRENFELEQKNLAIQEANRLKSEFVSMVSHEMRTPLTSIQGYVYLLLEGTSGDLLEEQRRFLTIVNENSERLLVLITDLLDLSRMEAGRLSLNLVAVDPGEVIRDVADALRPLIDSKSQSLELDLPDDLPAVWADPDRATQIVTNLVSNAHKYTPDGGHIWITARAADEAVEIAVRDDGLGLSQAEQTQLFSRFFRAQSAIVQRSTGTGLGLAITQQLVSLHGGQIRVESVPGQGSTFSVTLPTAPSDSYRSAPSDDLSLCRAPEGAGPRTT
ncbi:MAG TPA: sensor histidine kinase [Chloroflexota bacterium]|nr:sensor histidine kinase [Chloroflexota bacterium]